MKRPRPSFDFDKIRKMGALGEAIARGVQKAVDVVEVAKSRIDRGECGACGAPQDTDEVFCTRCIEKGLAKAVELAMQKKRDEG
jgi:hypothetical protein